MLGIEARGFIFAPALAYALGAGFVPVRKPRKLPAECVSVTYDLEYGTDTLEMHKDAIGDGQRVLIVDDLLATGGTAAAAAPHGARAGRHGGGHGVRGGTDLPQRARQAGGLRRLLAAAVRQMSATRARRARVRALAKINLDLRVLGKRPDGYHELRTVFQTISLADTIEIAFTPARRTAIELDDRSGIPDNLVVRAAQAGAGGDGRHRPGGDAAAQADSHGRRAGRRIVGRGGGAAGLARAGRAGPSTWPACAGSPENWAATCRSSCWAARRWESGAARSCFRCPTGRLRRPFWWLRGVSRFDGRGVSPAEPPFDNRIPTK